MENLDKGKLQAKKKTKKQTKQNLNIQISIFPLPYLLEFYSMKLHRSTCAALNGHINVDILGYFGGDQAWFCAMFDMTKMSGFVPLKFRVCFSSGMVSQHENLWFICSIPLILLQESSIFCRWVYPDRMLMSLNSRPWE